MRNGNAMAQPGRTQSLAREQCVEHQDAADAKRVFEQQSDVLEHPFLAGDIHIENDIRNG
jgi:hypothetical protein